MPCQIDSAAPDGNIAPQPQDETCEEIRELLVPPPWHGQRLDKLLVACVPEFSRSYLQQLLGTGAVCANGRVLDKPALRVTAGQRLVLRLRAPQHSRAFTPEHMALDVLHEDEHLLILNKRAGLVVHPAAGNWSGTLLNGLLARHASSSALPRAGIVHRLDKDTSGLMVVARSRAAMDALVAQMAARRVRRRYLALVHENRWPWGARHSINAPMGRDARNRLRMAVVRTGGKEARTDVDVLHHAQNVRVLRCTLHTGRTHQIRVHLSHLGHPLLADALYGGRPALGLARQALHAAHLALAHPVGGQMLEWFAPPPPDMMQALATLGVPLENGGELPPGWFSPPAPH